MKKILSVLMVIMVMFLTACSSQEVKEKVIDDNIKVIESNQPIESQQIEKEEEESKKVLQDLPLNIPFVSEKEKKSFLLDEDIDLTNLTIKPNLDLIFKTELYKENDLERLFKKYTKLHDDYIYLPNIKYIEGESFSTSYEYGANSEKHCYITRNINNDIYSISTLKEDSDAFRNEILTLIGANSYEDLNLVIDSSNSDNLRTQYISKDTDFFKYSDKELEKIKDIVNNQLYIGNIIPELFKKEVKPFFKTSDFGKEYLGYPLSLDKSVIKLQSRYDSTINSEYPYDSMKLDINLYNYLTSKNEKPGTVTFFSRSNIIFINSGIGNYIIDGYCVKYVAKTQKDINTFIEKFCKEYKINSLYKDEISEDVIKYSSVDIGENFFNVNDDIVNKKAKFEVEINSDNYFEVTCNLNFRIDLKN